MKLPFPIGARRAGIDSPPRPGGRRRRSPLVRVAIVALLVAVPLAALAWRSYTSRAAAPTPASAPVTWGNLDITVESSGTVKPVRSAGLTFQASGQVREVLVQPGARVQAGQPLARLDDRDLRLQVQQAEADLMSANAKLSAASNGSATSQELAKAEADLRARQADLEKARSGNITAADIREAEAGLALVQARLDALRNPSQDKLSSAEAAVAQAETNLQNVRDSASAEKTNAQLALEQAAADLTKAQASYSSAKSNWDYVSSTGRDPDRPDDAAQGGAGDQGINDPGRQRYYSTYVQAEADLRNAESAVARAQVAYDAARQQEPVKVQEAESKLEDARRQLDALRNPSAAALAEAQAEVDRERARVEQLRQGGTRAEVSAAQAQVDQSRASLEALSAPAATSEIAEAQAQVAQAQAKLEAAKLKLDQATLTATFAGTITDVDVVPGDVVGSGGDAALTLIDTSALHLDVYLSENDIMRVKPGQEVTVSFDMLKDQTFRGSVQSVAESGTESQNVVTYRITVDFDPGETAIKMGMTATAQILVERHQNVFQVPNRAIKRIGPARTIEVLFGDDQQPVTVPVETGATNGSLTEIVRCLNTDNQCLRRGDRVRLEQPSAPSAGPGGPGGDHMFIGPAVAPAGGPPKIIIRP